jgi:hypothetical protein
MRADIVSRTIQMVSCFDSGLRCLRCIDAHPRLFDETEKLLHVRTPVVHHILCAALVTEIYDPCWSVDTRPHRASHDQSTERILGLLRSEVEKGGQAHEGDAGIIFCDDSDVLWWAMRTERKSSKTQSYMLYYPRVQVFPMFVIRKDFRFAQEWPEEIYDARPSHKFIGDEGLDQVTKKREP